jgi:uncharacterized membrane protein
MRDKIVVILITLAVFLGGLITGVWTQKVRPSPPPPIPVLGELFGDRFAMHSPSPEEIARMEKKMEALKPEMDAFVKRMSDMQADFREKVRTVLREDQKKKWDMLIEKREATGAMWSGNENNKGREELRDQPRMPFPGHMFAGKHDDMDFVAIMIYKPLLEKLSKELGLDSGQREQVESLLRERRQKIIELVDLTPPPSIGMRMGRHMPGPKMDLR